MCVSLCALYYPMHQIRHISSPYIDFYILQHLLLICKTDKVLQVISTCTCQLVECIIVCITLLNQNMPLDASLNRKIFPFYLYSCANETVTEKMQAQQCGRPLTRQFVVHMQYAIIASHFVQNDEAPNNYVCTVSYLLNSVHAVSYIYIYLLASYLSIKTSNAEQLNCPLSVFIR